ncbi:hypothetical protein ACQ4LE_002128 [Meloidogyne hapla]
MIHNTIMINTIVFLNLKQLIKMIRTRLENLAKAQKRPLLENLSVDQTSSSHQSTSQQHAEDQINVGTESDENSDPEIQLIQFDTGKTEKGKMCLWHAGV